MINVKRLTVITLCFSSLSYGLHAQEEQPVQWTLQDCIDYALEQNITLRKNRINAESSAIEDCQSSTLPQPFFLYQPECSQSPIPRIKQLH